MTKYQDIKREREKPPFDGYRETHPCFGMANLSRVQGSLDLFGSVVEGRHGYITLTISRTERSHSYSQDNYYGKQELIEVAMSESQFAELITTWNRGEGIPVTLLRVSDTPVKEVPRISRQDQTETERAEDLYRDNMSDAVNEFKGSRDELYEILDKKGAINKSDREKIRKIFWRVDKWFTGGAPYAVKTFCEATERAASTAKIEVEAFVNSIIHKTGLDALKTLKLQGTSNSQDTPTLPVEGTDKKG